MRGTAARRSGTSAAGPEERKVLSKRLRGTYAGSTLGSAERHAWYGPHAARMRAEAAAEAEAWIQANYRRKGNAEARKLVRHYLAGR